MRWNFWLVIIAAADCGSQTAYDTLGYRTCGPIQI